MPPCCAERRFRKSLGGLGLGHGPQIAGADSGLRPVDATRAVWDAWCGIRAVRHVQAPSALPGGSLPDQRSVPEGCQAPLRGAGRPVARTTWPPGCPASAAKTGTRPFRLAVWPSRMGLMDREYPRRGWDGVHIPTVAVPYQAPEGSLRISNGSKASPSDAREKPPWAPPGTAATRPSAGKLPGLMAVCLEDGEGEGGPSLFGDGALAAAHRFFPYPLSPRRQEIVDLGRFYGPYLPRNVRGTS